MPWIQFAGTQKRQRPPLSSACAVTEEVYGGHTCTPNKTTMLLLSLVQERPSENSSFTALGYRVLRKTSESFYDLQLSCLACGTGVKKPSASQETMMSLTSPPSHAAQNTVSNISLSGKPSEICESPHTQAHTGILYTAGQKLLSLKGLLVTSLARMQKPGFQVGSYNSLKDKHGALCLDYLGRQCGPC